MELLDQINRCIQMNQAELSIVLGRSKRKCCTRGLNSELAYCCRNFEFSWSPVDEALIKTLQNTINNLEIIANEINNNMIK